MDLYLPNSSNSIAVDMDKYKACLQSYHLKFGLPKVVPKLQKDKLNFA